MRHDLFEPLTGRYIIKLVGGSRVAVQAEKGDANGEARPLVPIDKWVVHGDAHHVQRRLGEDVCAFVKRRVLRASQGAFEERAIAKWSATASPTVR
jgi:hypothetical protein